MISNPLRVFTLTLLLFLPWASHAAEDEIYTSFFSSTGAGGYDVVAYFTDGKPVEGDSDYSASYMGADWHFSSQANLDKFTQSPESYAPQYGGYCAWAVSNGDTASGDPQQWTVHGGKLYLNYDTQIQERWTADKDNLIVLSDQNWPSVLN